MSNQAETNSPQSIRAYEFRIPSQLYGACSVGSRGDLSQQNIAYFTKVDNFNCFQKL